MAIFKVKDEDLKHMVLTNYGISTFAGLVVLEAISLLATAPDASRSCKFTY